MSKDEARTHREHIPVTIEIAKPGDARAMALLEHANHVYRAKAGLLDLAPDSALIRELISDEAIATRSAELEQSNHGHYYLVAKERGRIAGMVGMAWQPDESRFQFKKFYVLPQYMGKGIGTELFSSTKRLAAGSRLHSKGMFLHTGDYNAPARKMYEHWGFRYGTPEESIMREIEPGKSVEMLKMILDFKNA